MTYGEDRKYSDLFIPQIETILKENSKYIVEIKISNEEDDNKNATDYIITIESGGKIACRVRREHFEKYPDFTIRFKRISGVVTEYEKLKNSADKARWYLFCWTHKRNINKIVSYIIIDLDVFKKTGFFNIKLAPTINDDGKSSFVFVPVKFLKYKNVIISSNNVDMDKLDDDLICVYDDLISNKIFTQQSEASLKNIIKKNIIDCNFFYKENYKEIIKNNKTERILGASKEFIRRSTGCVPEDVLLKTILNSIL